VRPKRFGRADPNTELVQMGQAPAATGALGAKGAATAKSVRGMLAQRLLGFARWIRDA